jgi:hypothetical protein
MSTCCLDDVCTFDDLSREVGVPKREISDVICCSRELADAMIPVGNRRVLPRSALPKLRAEIAHWRAKEGRPMPPPSPPVHMARQGYTASTDTDLPDKPNESINRYLTGHLTDCRPRPLVGGALPVSSEKGFERAKDSAAEMDRLRGIYQYVSSLSAERGVSVPNLLREMLQSASVGSDWRKALETLLTWKPND